MKGLSALNGEVTRQAQMIAYNNDFKMLLVTQVACRPPVCATAAAAAYLALVTTAYEAGSVTRVDVLTAQSQQAADATLLPPLRQKLSLARHILAVLAGRTPAATQVPEFRLDQLHLPASLPVSLPSQLVHDRPDILAAEAQLHAATAAVGVATANLYPTFSLSASATLQSLRPEELFNAASSAWGLIANLTAPLYDGGTLRARAMPPAIPEYWRCWMPSGCRTRRRSA